MYAYMCVYIYTYIIELVYIICVYIHIYVYIYIYIYIYVQAINPPLQVKPCREIDGCIFSIRGGRGYFNDDSTPGPPTKN